MFSNADLARLIIPLMFEQLLAMTIGMADTVMVTSVGEAAVSGISLVDSINILLINLFSALATGGAVVSSQYIGKRELGHASEAACQLYTLVFMASGLIMALTLSLRTPLLRLVFGSIEPEVMQNAQTYFLLSALSYPFMAVYNSGAAIFRAMGNSRMTLKVSVVMNLINIAGNAFTIYVLHMGVLGAGLSTLISRVIGAIIITLPLLRAKSAISLRHIFPIRLKLDMVKRILGIGIPSGLENSMFQFGKIVLQSLTSSFGTVSIAANAVGSTFCSIQVFPGQAVGLAMVTVIGQCVGAGEKQQARYYMRKMMLIAYIGVWSINLLIFLVLNNVLSLFNLSLEAEALAHTIAMMHGMGAMVHWLPSFSLPNALRAAGDAKFTMIVSVVSMCVLRILLSYVFALGLGMGVIGIWAAMQVDWLFRALFFIWRARGEQWLSKAVV